MPNNLQGQVARVIQNGAPDVPTHLLPDEVRPAVEKLEVQRARCYELVETARQAQEAVVPAKRKDEGDAVAAARSGKPVKAGNAAAKAQQAAEDAVAALMANVVVLQELETDTARELAAVSGAIESAAHQHADKVAEQYATAVAALIDGREAYLKALSDWSAAAQRAAEHRWSATEKAQSGLPLERASATERDAVIRWSPDARGDFDRGADGITAAKLADVLQRDSWRHIQPVSRKNATNRQLTREMAALADGRRVVVG